MTRLRAILFAALALLAAAAPAAGQRPNILVIMTDDQDYDSLAYMPKTQALLADKGVTFTNSFVQFPQCCPSRATWFSGQYAHNHGVLGNTVSWSGSYAAWKPSEANSLPVWLKAAGYRTAFLGKMFNGYELETYHVPPGWDWWRGLALVNYYDWKIYGASGTIDAFGSAPEDYLTDNQSRRTTNFMRTYAHNTPWFHFTSLFAPHIRSTGPAQPAPRHEGMFAALPMPKTPAFNSAHTTGKHPIVQSFPVLNEAAAAATEVFWRRQIETLQAVDDLVEAAVNQLAALGQLDNTYIVFTSDNGFLFGDWKRPTSKALPYERSIRVPLIIRGPGIPEGIERGEMVNQADIVATIVAWSGAFPGRVLDGRSLVPLFTEEPAAWRSALLFTGMYDPQQVYDHAFTRWNAVRTRNRKYIRASDGHEELYDLEADPWERFSVAADPFYAGDLAALRALEASLKSCAGATCWVD